MRLLITGARSQLAQDLQWVLDGEEIVAFDRSRLDITDREAVERAVGSTKPAWVINTAAFNDVDGAETAATRAFAVNADGPAYLGQAAVGAGARLMHISTDYVFDGTKGSAYTEDDRPNPLSVYGQSKYQGEQRVLESGVAALVVRTAWLYGRGGRNFVTSILSAAARGGPLDVVTDQVGSPTATWDLALAIKELIDADVTGLLHVVNRGACSRYEFARAIVGGCVDVRPISSIAAARPARRPANSTLTSIRLEAAGLAPLRDWQSALAAFLASLPAHGVPGGRQGPGSPASPWIG